MSDVPTGQIPSAENQQSIQNEADELAYELSFLPKMKKRHEKYLKRAIRLLGKIAVGAVAVDTNEECENGSLLAEDEGAYGSPRLYRRRPLCPKCGSCIGVHGGCDCTPAWKPTLDTTN